MKSIRHAISTDTKTKQKTSTLPPELLSRVLMHCDTRTLKSSLQIHTALTVVDTNPEILNSFCRTKNLSKDECLRILKANGELIRAIKRGSERLTTFNTGQSDLTQMTVFDDLILCSSDDQTLKVFDFNGFVVKKFVGHGGGIWTFDCDKKRVVTGSTDRTAKIWNLETEQVISTLKYHRSTVRAVKIHKDYIITGSRDYTIGVWNGSGNLLYCLEGHRQSVRCIDANDSFIVSGSYDGYCKLWDYKKGKFLKNIHRHQDRIYTVKILNSFVASAGTDTEVKVTNIETGQTKWHRIHNSVVGWLNFSGKTVISSSLDGTVVKFNYISGEPEFVLRIGAPIKGQKTTDSLIILATLNSVLIYSIRTGKFIRRLMTADAISKVEATNWKIIVGYQQGGEYKVSIFNCEPCK